jgi:hypothetical protein
MGKWQLAGGTAWALAAILLVTATLQPCGLAAAAGGDEVRLVSVCADGSVALAMGCESIHL